MCASLVDACNKYIQKYFVDVARSEEFLAMEQKDIVEILSNDELHVSSEEQVLSVLALSLKSLELFKFCYAAFTCFNCCFYRCCLFYYTFSSVCVC